MHLIRKSRKRGKEGRGGKRENESIGQPVEAEPTKEIGESGGAVSGQLRGEKGFQKEVRCGSSSFRERSDGVKAERRSGFGSWQIMAT